MNLTALPPEIFWYWWKASNPNYDNGTDRKAVVMITLPGAAEIYRQAIPEKTRKRFGVHSRGAKCERRDIIYVQHQRSR